MKKYTSSLITIFVLFTFTFFIVTGDLPLKASDEEKGIELMKAGEHLYDNFKYEESIEKFNQAKLLLKSKNNLSRLYFNLSRSYYALGHTVKTREILKKILNSAFDDTLFNNDLPKGFIDIYNSLKADNQKKIIEKPGKKKKKKGGILIIAGVIVAAALAFLLLKKKDESETTGDSTDPNYDTTTLGIHWVSVSGGEFKMGDNFNEGESDEKPVHTVNLSSYSISKNEITFEQYDKFCDDTGRAKPSDNGWGRSNFPVINVSWTDANAFCDWLAGKTGKDIHLPTEAQWEKAARGTNQSRYPWGNSMNNDYLNYNNRVGRITRVGTYIDGPSPYGVSDMAGNVSEWCLDWYSSSYYSVSQSDNPKGPVSGSLKVLRGGAWNDPAYGVRSARRYNAASYFTSNNLGFRICKE